MRIDAILPTRPNNLDRTDGALAHATNGTFREVIDAVRSDARPTRGPDAAIDATPETWSSADVDAFAVFAEANRRTESGGVASWSTLRTTAGAEHRASFGVAQLSIREHLGRLARASDAQLARYGTTRAEVDGMRRRGDAAIAFYHLVVDGRDASASATALGMDAAFAEDVRTLASRGDADRLRTLVGTRFEDATGLPASALDDLLATRALRDPAMREAFAAQYAHDHGVAFDPAHRDAARMSETAHHLALAHPELAHATTLLGGDDAARTSLAHYLGVGDSAENLLGWHERAASGAIGSGRLGSLLATIDGATSRAREIEDFEHARAAIAAVPDLHGDARVQTLARIGRIFHGAPSRARDALFVDGRLEAPRCQSRAELDALLDSMRSGRSWSDARLAEHVSQVVAERSAS